MASPGSVYYPPDNDGSMESGLTRAWVDVDTGALRENYATIEARTSNGAVAVMAACSSAKTYAEDQAPTGSHALWSADTVTWEDGVFAAEIVPEGGLERKLALGRPLRVKLGLDPTAPAPAPVPASVTGDADNTFTLDVHPASACWMPARTSVSRSVKSPSRVSPLKPVPRRPAPKRSCRPSPSAPCSGAR